MMMMMMTMTMIVIIYCKIIVEISGWWRYFCLIGHPTCDEDPFWPAFFGAEILNQRMMVQALPGDRLCYLQIALLIEN